ncbi:LysR family transcriptional regulator [Actinoallomurus acanthiterrae]
MGLIQDARADGVRLDQGEIEAFLALAEELHFGRAAERLNVSQPRVSQLLRSLERRIGGRLFERTSRRVQLTAFGTRLLERARPAYLELAHAMTDVRNLARGLRIGFLGPLSSTLDASIVAFRKRYPDCEIQLIHLALTDVFGPLRRAEIDLQVCLWPVEQEDLRVGSVIAELPRLLAIASSHPLAACPSLDIEDLAELKIIAPPEALPAELRRTFWPPAATPAGRPIRRTNPACTEQEILGLVAYGSGVYLTTTAMPSHFSHPGVTFVPFTGMPPARAVIAWHADNPNHKVIEFVQLAERRPQATKPDLARK